MPTYKMKNSDIRSDKQQLILKALESLATSYTSDTLKSLIERYNAIIEKEGGQKVFWCNKGKCSGSGNESIVGAGYS